MKMRKKKKGPFDDLSGEFKDAVTGSKEEQIRERIAQIALDDEALRKAKDEDEDLKEKKLVAAEANGIYSKAAKMNRLKIKFCKQTLEDMGKPTA